MKALRSPFRSRAPEAQSANSATPHDQASDHNGQKESQDSRYLTAPDEIVRCLKTMRDQRTVLKLRLENNGRPGTPTEQIVSCKILDVTSNGFLIEDISPRSALALMHTRPAFSISARDQGTYAFVEDSRVLSAGEERGVPYFHVPLPERVLFQQRRRAARFSLPMRVAAANARVTLYRDVAQAGRLIDISVGGCRVAFEPPHTAALELEEHISNCRIELPPRMEIHSEVIVRHCHQRKDNVLVCGLELITMHVTDRRRLEQFVQTLNKHAEAESVS